MGKGAIYIIWLTSNVYLSISIQAYTFDPLADLTAVEVALVLGGQQLLWTEQSSAQNLDSIVWPRTAASAEVRISHLQYPFVLFIPTFRRSFGQELPFQVEVNRASSLPFFVFMTYALEWYKGASTPLHYSHNGVLFNLLFYNKGQIFRIVKCSTKRCYVWGNYNLGDICGTGVCSLSKYVGWKTGSGAKRQNTVVS